MELTEVQKLIDNLPIESRSAITELIDIKTNDNMKEVLTAINSLRSDMDSKFNSIDMRLKTLYWVVGGIATVGVALYAALIGVLWK